MSNLPTPTVVNVKVKYIRPQGYSNLKDWMTHPDHVYIGRRGIVFIDNKRFPIQDSVWANPFKITKNNTREQVLIEYEQYIRKQLQQKPELKKELLKLQDKTLGCWCVPEACHGHILVKILEELT